LAHGYVIVKADEFIPTRASLLSRLKDWGDQTSWREFFDTYGQLIYGVARKAGLSEAEAQEALQETLIAVAKKMPGFTYDPANDSFKGWLLRVTQWKIADQFRKHYADKNRVLPNSTEANDSRANGVQTDSDHCDLQAIWDDEWQAHLLSTALNRVKRRVKPEHYEVYYLHIIKEQTARDVSRTLGVSIAQIHMVKHRVGRLLKKEIERLQTVDD
jgi:RNA polymerase sigma-70 factor (ECF subfamily)